jgi:hypothetical protein
MKNRFYILAVLMLLSLSVRAQKLYTVSGGEIIFQSSSVEKKTDGVNTSVNTNLRFTLFLHIGEYLHYDFNDHVGMFTGLGIRNVGFITEEDSIKDKYRTYNLGMPLAIKFGSFKKNLFLFGGAEYEWMFHFKHKTFVENTKTKYTSWFSHHTPALIPSVFVGLQLPAGFQFKFRYYLDNYLEERYTYTSAPQGYNKTQVWYISVSYQIRNNKIKEYKPISTDMAIR